MNCVLNFGPERWVVRRKISFPVALVVIPNKMPLLTDRNVVQSFIRKLSKYVT